MNNITAKQFLLLPLFVSPMLLVSPATFAEIVEIPADEMTESYIKDTTVIVRKQAPTEVSKTRTVIRVSPLEEDFSEGQATAEGTSLLRQAYEQLPPDTTAQTQYQFEAASNYQIPAPVYDADRHANDDRLRAILGLDVNEPIDYSNLQFPTGAAPDGTLLPDNLAVSGPQFQIIIPNSNNYRPESYNSQNGEVGVSVTPDQIILQVNAPR